MKHTKSISFLILVATLFFYLGEGDVFAQTNIARGKTAKQSSTAYGGEANRGVDGNTDGNYGSNSVTHTDDRNDRNQWWEVDLGKSYNIASIKIHNRTDCCADRLKDIYILVSETPIQSTSWQDQALSAYYGYNETYTPGPVVHTKNAKGRYVRIFRQAGAPLSLAEVEVFEGQAAPQLIGQTLSFQSVNYSSKFIRHQNYEGKITDISSELDKKDASFKVVASLDGRDGYVSLESVNFPGFYLRHQGFILKLHKRDGSDLFNKDASFKIVDGLERQGISFQSSNYPDLYIRHQGFILKLHPSDKSPLFNKDASFIPKPAFVKEETPTPTKTEAKPVPTKPTIETGTPIEGGGTTKGIATENIKAFVWYNETTKPSSALSAGYQYNSVGGAITGERIGQGQYKLTIPNMAKHYDGACHVTAYSGNHSAQVEQWNASGNDLHVKVRVFDAKGAPTDGRFSAIFYKETRPNANSAYLWASAEGKPNHKYQYNGKGAISMTKTGTGVYQVTFEGIQMTSGEGRGGNVIATPYGADARRVQVVSWLNRGANTVVTLNTYDFNGEPADTRFVVSYNSDWTNQAAYAWGNAATKTTQYEADKSYQMNNVSTAENMVTRLGAGSYKVTLPGIKNANASNAIATAYGNNKAYATIVRWSANSETKGTDVYVNTYTPDGQPADSQFSLFYTTNSPVE